MDGGERGGLGGQIGWPAIFFPRGFGIGKKPPSPNGQENQGRKHIEACEFASKASKNVIKRRMLFEGLSAGV